MGRKKTEITIEPEVLPIGPGNPPKRVKSTKKKSERAKITRAEAIKLFCIECMGYNKHFVKSCTAEQCPLWCYRSGYGFQDTNAKIHTPKTWPKDKLAGPEDDKEDDR